MKMKIPSRRNRGRAPEIPPPRGFETYATAKDRRDILVSQLRRAANQSDPELAAKLESCSKSEPCQSNACPICLRRFRLRLYRSVNETLSDRAFEVARVSVIPADCRVELGELWATSLDRWVASRKRAIERALPPECAFIGGVDISLNNFENSDPHWCLHLYGFVIAPAGWGLHDRYRRRRLRAEFDRRCRPIPKADRVASERPLLMGPRSVEDFYGSLLYAHKADFYCRTRWIETKRKSNRRSSNSKAQKLPTRSCIEVAMFVDGFRLGSRLILVGIRRRGCRGRPDRFTLTLERDFSVVTNRPVQRSKKARRARRNPCEPC